MPTDKHELERRLALTRADHLVRGFNFGAVLELVEAHAGADAASRLRTPIGPRVLGFFNYPAADFLRLTWAAADLLEPAFGSTDAAFTEMGRAAAKALSESAVGKMLIGFVRGSPPQQLVRHAPTAYGMAVSHAVLSVSSIDERSARMNLTTDFMPPAFHVGILSAGLQAAGLDVNVEGMATGTDAVELLVRWVSSP